MPFHSKPNINENEEANKNTRQIIGAINQVNMVSCCAFAHLTTVTYIYRPFLDNSLDLLFPGFKIVFKKVISQIPP